MAFRQVVTVLCLVVTMAAGCLGLSSERIGGYSANELEKHFESGTEFSLSLHDIPTGEDAVLLELVARPGTKFDSVRSWSFPLDHGDRVGAAELRPGNPELCRRDAGPFTWYMHAAFKLGGQVRTNGAGDSIEVSVDPFPVDQVDSKRDQHIWSEPGPMALLMAISEADSWKDAGAEWTLDLRADKPFYWRIHPPPKFECALGPSAFEEGFYLDTGWVVRAEGMERSFDFEGKGQMIGLVASTMRHEVRLTGDDEQRLAHISAGSLGQLAAGLFLNTVHPGTYTVHLDRLEGHVHPFWLTTIVVSAVDWPEWHHG